MRKIFVLWLLLLSVVSLAQPYSVKQLGIEKGLSNNYVVSIAQDKQGFLWFATEEGLNKFDGTRFITYLKNEDLTRQGITGNELNCLLDDPQDSILWIGTQRAGLNAYDYVNNTFLCYRHDGENPESLITDDVTKIVAATDGNLWITTYWRGVDYFDKKAGKFIHYNTQTVPGLASDNIWSVVDGGDGKLYMGHVHHGFSVLSLKDKKVTNFMHDPEDPVSLPGNGVTCIYKDLSGNIWLGTDRGLALFNPEAENFIHFHHSEDGVPHTVFDIRQFDGNKLWIAMEFGGIAILDLTQRMFLSPDQVRFQYKKKLDMESLYELEKKNHEQEQELNNERLRFYTNITHELRTPLTLILGPLEDMQKSNSLSGKDSQKISVIHQSAIRLLNLINQILEFRKTETQNKKLCVSRDNLAALVHEIGLKYKELNRKPEIDFCLEIEQEDMSLFFDKEVVTIILDNLISNAIKYTEKGTITLGLHQVVRNNIHHTEISVSDTGFGIAPDALPHIFDRYYQEGSEHQASGTGIGLALVKNLVVLHEGEIRVESSLNVGSTFYVSLLTDNTYPHVLHTDSTEKTSDEKGEKEENTEPVHSGKRILLIVEDNRDICDYIVESFSDDFEVRTAANGEQGLEQALGCIPDIIVSDIMMPVMNGIVMCRKLKEDLRTSHIPIILLTAKDSLQDKEEGYQVGADSYLTKPFSATLLHSRIHNLLESRKLLAERFNTNSILIDKRAAVTESMNKLDNEFLEKINKLIEDRLSSEKIDIGYLSDAMCMSNSTLYRKMKALTGLSTNEYIRKIKMQYAERLLLEGKYNISEVAFKVGINSTVYFRQCFKDEFGMAPSDYLKKIKPE